MKTNQNLLASLAVIGNYTPRKCGIATYTADVCTAIAAAAGVGDGVEVVAMDDVSEGYDYPERVKFEVLDSKQSDYLRAADYLNLRRFDVALLQHEYGIFGGTNGSHILFLIKALRMPVVTTLHSVLFRPSEEQRHIVQSLAEYSDCLIGLSRKATAILQEVYGVPEEKLTYIPHGIPDIPFRNPDVTKPQFGLEGRKVILTFGLLGPGKGIEVLLKAIPAIAAKVPDVLYVVLGATHPQVRKFDNDQYRQDLMGLVSRFGIEDHVLFLNQFVSLEVLCRYLSAADVYCTPYPSREQVVSGTLAYAMGAGAAVVSTPYWHAEEMLADGRGRLVPFEDAGAFAREITSLLLNDTERASVRQKAHQHCRRMIWKSVARDHVEVLLRATARGGSNPRPPSAELRPRQPRLMEELPEPNLRHLFAMTDDTGILKDARNATPSRREGYRLDDNAQALVAASLCYALWRDASVLPLIQVYLAFLQDAFVLERGRFRDRLSYDRRWAKGSCSEDSHGRALLALGEVVRHAPNEAVRDMATGLFLEALPVVDAFRSERALAFVLIGLHSYLEPYGGDAAVRRLRAKLALRLHEPFEQHAAADWPWCEETLAGSNGKLPHALILSGQWIPAPNLHESGIRSLRWLLEKQTAPEGHLTVFGTETPYSRDGRRSTFSQSALEPFHLVEACAEAYRSTGEREWRYDAERCLRWYLGYNDLNTPLYDYKTGGCCGELQPHGPSRDQCGAPTLAWLISLLTIHQIAADEIRIEKR